MPVTPPLNPGDAPSESQSTLEQVKGENGNGEVPTEYQMMAHVPAFLGDAHANRQKYVDHGSEALTHPHREALALATSVANNCKSCTRAHAQACEQAGWSEAEVAEIVAVASTGAMYNFFYKYRDAVSDEHLKGIKPMLRAHTWRGTSLDTVLVELIATIVSVVNSCHHCIDAHTNKALEAGATHEQIEAAIRLAAAMTAYNTYFRSQ
jgi:alkyl hydroperoxide reductase subunit D